MRKKIDESEVLFYACCFLILIVCFVNCKH